MGAGSLTVDLIFGDLRAVSYIVDVYRYNETSGMLDLFYRRGGVNAGDFPVEVPNAGRGYYQTAVRAVYGDGEQRSLVFGESENSPKGRVMFSVVNFLLLKLC